KALMRIKAPVLFIHQEEDLIFPSEAVRDTAATIRTGGVSVEFFELTGEQGHVDGIIAIEQASSAIRDFLER
ncbi:MAG: E22 family MetX-like putative esterase, partial [Hyphococcus sp.]